MVFIPSQIQLSTEEKEWIFSDIFVQIDTFLLSFLERGSQIEKFSQLRLQRRKNYAENLQTSPLSPI